MSKITVRNLRDDLPFGSLIEGLTYEALGDPAVRDELNQLFEKRGLIVFKGVEATGKMQISISEVFGSLRDPGVKNFTRADKDGGTGVVDMHYEGREDNGDLRGLLEMDGKIVARFTPWHFDSCYTNRLNRAAVLRAVINAPEGGRTGFLDGIDLYREMPADLRDRIEGLNIIYNFEARMSRMRFGRNFKDFGDSPDQLASFKEMAALPRAMHPAVWTRDTGEKVMHVGVLMTDGIENQENPEGDALLEEVCQWINKNSNPYWHEWDFNDMVIWDNWRMLHAVEGFDPKFERRTLRTTIEGDYGLGFYEGA